MLWRHVDFFYTHFTLRYVETYPYFWTSDINLVSQSSLLYKIRVLAAKMKLLIIREEIVFCQQQKKTYPNNWIWPDFKLIIYLVGFDRTQTLIFGLNRGVRGKQVLKRWIWFVLARIPNSAVQSQSKHHPLSLHNTCWTPLRFNSAQVSPFRWVLFAKVPYCQHKQDIFGWVCINSYPKIFL